MSNEQITRDSLQIARLEERLQTVVRDMEQQNEKLATMGAQLDKVLATLSEARGGWKTLMWIGGASASAGGFVSWALNHLTFK
jgi:hypothetical protein